MVGFAVLNISIVLFNNEIKQIENLLNDIFSNDIILINKVYLIDNSKGSNLAIFSNYNSNIEYIHHPQNLGYGIAHNIAIQKSIDNKIKYHLVLNPDIRLQSSTLFKLTVYLNESHDVGLVMPDICYPNGSRQYLCKLLPNPLLLFSRRFLPQVISTRIGRKYNLLDMDYKKEMNVPLLSGCFMFMRTKALAEVGMFDPRFFMYLEDFDLARRIRTKYRTMFYPHVKVMHEHTKGSYKNLKLTWHHVRSAIKYFNKHGWLNDKERKRINATFLKQYKNS